MDRERELHVRMRVFDHLRSLREREGGAVPSGLLEERLRIDGVDIAIMSRQKGIHRPAQLDAALTLKTSASAVYPDAFDEPTASLHYHYRDPNTRSRRAVEMAERDNADVRATIRHDLPVAYLWGVDKGWYLPFAPAVVVGDDPAARQFLVDLTELGGRELTVVAGSEPVLAAEAPTRRYQARVVNSRLHQARFRQLVLRAYRRMCAMCSLRHVELLDAAHLLEDAEGGEPTVSNGMALCKIHHAAFDQRVIGVEPDTHLVRVRSDVLREVDGPMLRYGLQALEGSRVTLPSRTADRPAAEALERRWERFRAS